ncbi:MAG: hypothetical protein HYS15_02085 [Candidatus Spechtbacteria bacterium]|nr:hypothetical protein [Candidatus Spechtbacteria bacterium]
MTKIFLIEWPENLAGIARELQKRSCEILYWTGVGLHGSSNPLEKEFPQTIFQNSYDSLQGLDPSRVDSASFEPLSRDVIRRFFECEAATLAMMDRIDYSDVPVRRRKRLYYKLLKYWFGVLKNHTPDAIVFSVTPHLVYDFVLYWVAKDLGICTLMFIPTRIPERLLLIDDIEGGSLRLTRELEGTRNVRFEDLSKDLQDYYISQTTPKNSSRFPFYTHADLYKGRIKVVYVPSLARVFASIVRGDFLSRAREYSNRIFFTKSRLLSFDAQYTGLGYQMKLLEWEKAKREFEKEYRSLVSPIDWNKKFIYAPLQFQPERSTSPEGGIFADQFLMIDILSHSVPSDWVVYVKEHLSQWTKGGTHAHQGRYRGYYKELAAFPNVRLIAPEILSNELIAKCEVVSSVAGTGSWEGILNGKPSLMFGYPSYKDCSEVLKVSDVQSCKAAIQKIASGWKPDKQKVLNYLGAFDKASIKGRIEQGVEKTSLASPEENNKAIAEGIYGALRS